VRNGSARTRRNEKNADAGILSEDPLNEGILNEEMDAVRKLRSILASLISPAKNYRPVIRD
jgi:hypothetical protein